MDMTNGILKSTLVSVTDRIVYSGYARFKIAEAKALGCTCYS